MSTTEQIMKLQAQMDASIPIDIITTVCGWCGVIMSSRPGYCSAGQISHSICPTCLEQKL